MERHFLIYRIALLASLLLFLIGCETRTVENVPIEENYKLTELQVSACNAAHDAQTCETRLPEVGIVLKEDCCKALGKCC